MYLVVNCGMVQQVDHSHLIVLPSPLASFDGLLDAEIQVSRCLGFVLSQVCQISVSEMPKWGWLLEAILEGVPYLLYYLMILDFFFKSVPAVVCFISSCHKYEGPLPVLRNLVHHEDHFHSPLEDLPCGYLVCCSPVHLRILLPWDRRHVYCNETVLSGPRRKTGWEISLQQLKIVTLRLACTEGCLDSVHL